MMIDILPPLPVSALTVQHAARGEIISDISAWRYLLMTEIGTMLAEISVHSPRAFSSLKRGMWADRFSQAIRILDHEANLNLEDRLCPSVIEFPSLQTSAIAVRGMEQTWYVPMSINGILVNVEKMSKDEFMGRLSSAAAENMRNGLS
jgi:hypothetical protein